MKINANNYRQFTYFILVLVAISGLFAYGISQVINYYGIKVPFYIEVPSIALIYGFLFFLFDKHLWRWRIFKSLGIVVAVDLNGKWHGIAKSSHNRFQTDITVDLLIEQSGTEVIIRGKFENSKSVSLNANFERSDVDDTVALFYFYRNEPNYNAVGTMSMHEGSTKLVYDEQTDSLKGFYYSGRDRNNYGTIEVRRV